MKKKRNLFLVFILVVALVLTACTTPAGKEVEKPEVVKETDGKEVTKVTSEPKVLRGSILGEPQSLDSQKGQDVNSALIRSLIYDPIVRNYNNEFIPGGAETWDISEDGLTYTFHLRKDNKWSDGEPITAHDYVYSTIRLIDPADDAPNGSMNYYGFYLVNAKAFNEGTITDPSEVGVKALDDYTVEYTLEKPYAYFMNYLTTTLYNPTRKDYVEKYGLEYATTNDRIMGNGPYILVDWKPEDRFIFEKNENYWNADAVNFDRVELFVIGDANTTYLMYQNGELDWAKVPKDLIPAARDKSDFRQSDSATSWWMEVNQDSNSPAAKFLANANFRKAIGHAIDREAFIKVSLDDGSVPSGSYLPNGMIITGQKWGEKFDNKFWPATEELEKAEEYLAKALEELGETKENIPTIRYLTDDRPERRLMAELVQDMLSKTLGIDLDITLVQSKQRWALMTDGDYDIVFAGVSSSNPDPIGFLIRLTSDNGLNDTRWGSEEYDRLIEESDSVADQEERAKMLYQALTILMEEGPLIPVYVAGNATVVSEKLVDFYTGGIRGTDPEFIYADRVE